VRRTGDDRVDLTIERHSNGALHSVTRELAGPCRPASIGRSRSAVARPFPASGAP
jgi:hypothetical protein